ncbi:MAG: phosphate ABC transporter permease subunit PstC [Pseudanabaenaceae cyanobacterium SKYGB_i_bin29]|nr:phosphate ABC transporter permease subunit PstC [Pseudanabaenaceae cyanobacterium SKYG29]MDW8421085.1 phosphate ABC transporter permease subunit PstC [Pseudanabaenaceae cyanobacterium SKYGB_i_bin29]
MKLWTKICAFGIVILLGGVVIQLLWSGRSAMWHYGWQFLLQSAWNPVRGEFGILPRLYGTIVTSLLALVMAAPVGLATALWLSVAPSGWLGAVINSGIELLAAIPSVVYGLWGIFVLIPWLTPHLQWLHRHGGWLPFFATPFPGRSLLVAALVLAVMILPTIVALSRVAISNVPGELIWGALALGATPWEVLLAVALPYSRSGIIAAILLALGRALGETMAVTMLIGNSNTLSLSWLAPADTIASLLANNFAEAGEQEIPALMYAALVLLVLSLAVNLSGELILGNGSLDRNQAD